MASRTYEVEFVVTYHGQIEADSDAEAQAKLDEVSVDDTSDGDEWTVDPWEHQKSIVNSWDNDDDEDDATTNDA